MPDRLVRQLLQQSLDDQTINADAPTSALIVRLLQRTIEQNERILEEHAELKTALTNHTLNEESLVAGFMAAFPKRPDGKPDFEGHEEFHTALIEEARARADFFRGLRYKLFEKGIWGLLIVLWALITYWWGGQLRGGH